VNIHDSHGRVLDVDRIERDSRPDYEMPFTEDPKNTQLLIALILIIGAAIGLVKLLVSMGVIE
jgi:hypothetical protein